MTGTEPSVEDGELHAFVDGQLDVERVPAVLRHLQAHPDTAIRVAQWHAQRLQLRRLHRNAEPGPTPAALTDTVLRGTRRARWRTWAQAAAALLLLLGGAAGGHFWSAFPAQQPPVLAAAAPTFVRDAAVAYAVFSPEVRHPVEVSADDETHLVQWLSRRLGRPLTAPVLQTRGFRLLGGRLLPGDPTPRAQFMYEDTRGRRVTLYVAVFPDTAAPRETAFRSVKEGNSESFYWIENGYGYALSADLPASDLQGLASDVYDQLYPH